MRKTITVGELERLYKSRGPGRFLFNAEDQNWIMVGSPVRFCSEFETLQVAKNPDIIYLKNGIDFIYFQKIRHIIVDDEKSILGTLLHIVCDSVEGEDAEIRYTIIDTRKFSSE